MSQYSDAYEAASPYMKHLQSVWGADLPVLLAYVERATRPWRDQEMNRFRDSVRCHPGRPTRTLVVVGERDVHSSEEQFAAAQEACATVLEVSGSCLHDTSRADPGSLLLLFTGGAHGVREPFAEVPALELMFLFRGRYGDVLDPYISVDQVSPNTRAQAQFIGSLIRSFPVDRIVFTLPIEHIARFAATLYGELSRSTEQELRLPMPFFLGAGRWSDWTRDRSSSGLTRAREAFGSVQVPGDPEVLADWKLLGSEYGVRYQREVEVSSDRVASALSPGRMLEILGEKPR